MPPLHFVNVAVTALVVVPAGLLARHLAVSPEEVGRRLAEQVDAHVRRARLGYYPALDYFAGGTHVDPELLDAARQMGGLVEELVRSEVRDRLDGVFSQVRFPAVHCVAFTLPGVRPGDPDALDALAGHYTPDTVKLGLLVTSIEKTPRREGMARLARQKILRWLERRFAALTITSAEVV